MRYPSKSVTNEARTRLRADDYADDCSDDCSDHYSDHRADSQSQLEPAQIASAQSNICAPENANTRAGASHSVLFTVAILLVVVPIVLITAGCTQSLLTAELSIPGVLLNAVQQHRA